MNNQFARVLILFVFIVFTCCKEKPSLCTSEGYHLPKDIWEYYYPYADGQEVSFINSQGDTMTFRVRIINAPSYDDEYYTFEYYCNHPFDSPADSYYILLTTDNGYNINLELFGGGKKNAVVSFSMIVNHQARYKFKYEGDVADFYSMLGDTIHLSDDSSIGMHELNSNTYQIKGKGLASFFDLKDNCVWHLIE